MKLDNKYLLVTKFLGEYRTIELTRESFVDILEHAIKQCKRLNWEVDKTYHTFIGFTCFLEAPNGTISTLMMEIAKEF